MTKLALVLILLPGWMTGTWRSEQPNRTSEEVWSRAHGTLMTGMHRDIRPNKTTWFEFLRIERRGDTLVYIAMPGGASPTEFTATRVEESRIVFENPKHDFPQRIIYWRDGAKLCARTEGSDGKGEQWCWQAVQ